MRPLLAAAALALLLPSGLARAQRGAFDSDAEWLEHCREQRWHDGDDRGRACEVRDVPVKLAGRSLAVSGAPNGSVRAVGRDGDAVKVTARIQADGRTDADARSRLAEIRIVADGRNVRAEGPPRDGRDDGWSVSYVLEVPRRFDLDLESRNGSLGVSGVSGAIELRATNGSVALSDVGGDVRAHTQNGSLNVQLSGKRWDGAGLDAETHNGSVRVRIPDDYSARLETHTVNGSLRTDFPVTVRGRISRDLTLPLGAGGAPIRVTTTNGSVTLTKS
jgi:hypothetical protein